MKMSISKLHRLNLVPVPLKPLCNTRLLRRGGSRSPATGELSDSEFLTKYSYALADSAVGALDSCAAEVPGDIERYGGEGIGCNGGGARVANISDVQLKGVGANLLAGTDAPVSHSYGGLDIQGAVKEIIYAQLVAKISPVGGVAHYGLIDLGSANAVFNGDNSTSVILVREAAIRPAHFMPAPDFRQNSDSLAVLPTDGSRIKLLFREIDRANLGSEFLVKIQEFLIASADQLAFMRMARFSHNALIASNISLDGRLLDTGLCSFVPSGSQYGEVTSYAGELALPVFYARAMMHQLAKFGYRKLGVEHMYQLYSEQVRSYLSLNLGYCFGVDRDLSIRMSALPAWKELAIRLEQIFVQGDGNGGDQLPTVDSSDPANNILTASLYGLLHEVQGTRTIRLVNEITGALRQIVQTLYAVYEGTYADESAFRIAFALQVLKRAIYNRFFYITYIGRAVDEAFKTGGSEAVLSVLQQCENAMTWIISRLQSKRCLSSINR